MAAGPATMVSVVAAARVPAVAVTGTVPAVEPSATFVVTCPATSVKAVAFENDTEPPCALHTTVTFGTGLLSASTARATSGAASVVPGPPLCPPPDTIESAPAPRLIARMLNVAVPAVPLTPAMLALTVSVRAVLPSV